MKKQKKFTDEEAEEFTNDLILYSKKLNMMILESCEGSAPQIYKIILTKRLIDKIYNEFKKRFEKDISVINEIIDEFLELFVNITDNEELVKKQLYEQ